MAEATKTLPVQFSFKKGQGRGSKVLAMKITIAASSDTVTTPLKTVHSAVVGKVGAVALGAADIEGVDVVSVADGVITIAGWLLPIPGAGAVAALATDAYLIAIGSTKEYAT